MKFVSYESDSGVRSGALIGTTVVEINGNLQDILSDKASLSAEYSKAESNIASGVPLDSLTLMPPILRPGKVVALGRNYAAHAAEGGAEPPKFPMLFHKTHTSLNGHKRPIVIPNGTEQVDFEAELAVIIGRTCKNVDEADAMDYVAGYAVANDVTARDWQRRTSQFSAGKMVDGFGPLGPAFVTADEINDVQNLDIKCWLNGDLMQSSNTAKMIFNVAFTIAYISRISTLEVGDVILTGTPEGVGYARTPPVYMQPGDVVTVEVSGVGSLTNHFVTN